MAEGQSVHLLKGEKMKEDFFGYLGMIVMVGILVLTAFIEGGGL